MDLTGRYHIPAPPQTVWRAINDPDVLKACIPGCESIAKTDDTHFQAAARLKIGPVSATFKGVVALEELDPPRRCVLKGEGQGGVAGFAKGEAEVLLEPAEGGTDLTYNAKASVGGKLAQIGQRLIAGAAKQITDDFFAKFVAEVTGESALRPAAEQAALQAEAITATEGDTVAMTIETLATQPLASDGIASPAPLAPAGAEPDSAREGMAPEIWVVGLVAVIVILLILFGLVL